MQTRTYAEILARQGEFAQAIAIYQKLIAKAPHDPTLTHRMREIEALAAGLEGPVARPKSRRQERLEVLLHRIQSRRR